MGLSVRLQRHRKFSHTFRPISWVEVFKVFATYLYYTKYNDIKYFIELHKSMFRIQEHTKDFCYIMGCTWKRLDVYFKYFFRGLIPSY